MKTVQGITSNFVTAERFHVKSDAEIAADNLSDFFQYDVVGTLQSGFRILTTNQKGNVLGYYAKEAA